MSLAVPVRGLKSQGIREEHPRGYFPKRKKHTGETCSTRCRAGGRKEMEKASPNHLSGLANPPSRLGGGKEINTP